MAMTFREAIQSALEETPGVVSMTRLVMANNTFFFGVIPAFVWVNGLQKFDAGIAGFCVTILTITYGLKGIQSFADNLGPKSL